MCYNVTTMKAVYRITNTETSKVYIGSTTDVADRWSNHRSMLKYGKHHSKRLQNSYNKHGKSAFVYDVIETIDDDDKLIPREQYWMDFYESYKKGYNANKTSGSYKHAIGNTTWLGRKHSDETKALCVERAKANSDENSERMTKYWSAKHAEDLVNELKAIELFRDYPDKTIKDISIEMGRCHNWLYGVLKRHGIPAQRGFRAGTVWNKGKTGFETSVEAREKHSKASADRWADPDFRQRMSDKHKENWANPSYRDMMTKAQTKKEPKVIEPRNKVHSDARKKQWSDPAYRKMMSEAHKKKVD